MDSELTIITVHRKGAPGISGVLTPTLLTTLSKRTGLTPEQIEHYLKRLLAQQAISMERYTLH